MAWDTAKIIEEHGGAKMLHAKLIAAGHDLTLHSVQAWSRRKSIPSEWLAILFEMQGENPRDWIVEDIF